MANVARILIMRTRLRVIVPRRLVFNPKKLNAAINDALDDAAKEVRRDFDETVSSWDTAVRFVTFSRTGERIVSTKSDIYRFVNDGTKKHKIEPRKAKLLAFKLGGAPKTRAGVIGSGPGHAGGVTAFAKAVMHPGIKARRFNKAIKTKWQKLLPKLLQDAINDAL
jgi:hypothetical protein